MAPKLRDTSILITGASAGIGYLAAEAMARAGAKLILHGRGRAKVERCVRALSGGDAPVRGVVADLASLDQTRQLAEQVAREEPSLDVLINNAAIGFGQPGAGRELSTLLDTNMVKESGIPARGPASRGAASIMTVLEHALAGGESGLYFDEQTPARANPQAYDRRARERLRAMSLRLTAR